LELPPKEAISKIQARGGVPSGASGISVPGTPVTNNAFKTGTSAINKLNKMAIAGGEISDNKNRANFLPERFQRGSSGVDVVRDR
jgi:hypothetical protein